MQDDLKPRTTSTNSEPATGYAPEPSMADGVEMTEKQPQTASVVPAEGEVKKKSSNVKWVVIIVLAFIIGALAGYLVGASMKENELTAQHDAEISRLEADLATTKDNVAVASMMPRRLIPLRSQLTRGTAVGLGRHLYRL